VTLVTFPCDHFPPRGAAPTLLRDHSVTNFLQAAASLPPQGHARARAPSTPAGRAHTRSNGAGHRGREEGALLGVPGVAVHLQKDSFDLGVPAPGLWGQRGRTTRHAPCQNHWYQPLGAPRVHGVHRGRRSGRFAHSPDQL
jgi:hypothetical protein